MTSAQPLDSPFDDHPTALAAADRYPGTVRGAGAVTCGVIAGLLLVNSIQVGAAFGITGHAAEEWTILQWDDHWMWRAIASLAATFVAGFLAGMVARRQGRKVAILSALPTAVYWALVAYVGWIGHIPASDLPAEVPLGYRIIAVILVLATLPCAAAGGVEGAAYGRANAAHCDSRRGSLLGVRWYHYLWLPLLLHLMVLTASFGVIYGFQWVVTGFRNGFSLFAFVPFVFVIAMVFTLQILASGATKTYEALAGFDDSTEASVLRRVVKYGFGYTLGAIVAQAAIAAAHFGLVALVQKLFG